MKVAFNEMFVYDESSPTCLRWKVDRLSGHHRKIKSASAGDIAGSLDARKEAFVVRCGGLHKVHRIIVQLHGVILAADDLVDHFDGNPENNRIGNLRVTTGLTNSHNRRKQHNNTSGTVGVSGWTDQRGSIFWVARWQVAVGKRSSKSFSIAKYGATEAYLMAVAHREAMIQQLTKQGHGYTERHGK